MRFAALLVIGVATGQNNPPGRYSHCAVAYFDHMIIYGGRGFHSSSNPLETIGSAPRPAAPWLPAAAHT